MKRFKWCLTDPDLWTEVSGVCPLICQCVSFCMCLFKGESVIVSWLTISFPCVVVVQCEVAIVLQSKSINLFRDTETGPNLSVKVQIGWLVGYVVLCLFLDNSGCPSIVEQWSQRLDVVILLLHCSSLFLTLSYALCLVPSFLQHKWSYILDCSLT